MTKKQPMKAVRGWAVIIDGEFYNAWKDKSYALLERAEAQAFDRQTKIAPVLITPIKNPKKR